MSNTRQVTGPILGPEGEPLADFVIKFAVTRGPDGSVQYTEDGHYPWTETTVTTDEHGQFALDMVTGITYAVQFTGAIQDDGRVKSYPPGVGRDLELVVPDGPGSISLQTIRALGSVDPDDPSVADIITNAINEYMANNGVADAVDTINSHVADTDNPHGVTAGQLDLENVANLTPADMPVSDATQDALDAKADTSSLGTAAAADVGDFATAAQGDAADTAVQPSQALTDAIDQRHEHANKALLDTVTPELLVPGGGEPGQVLTVGDGDAGWGNPLGHNPYLNRANRFITTGTHGLGIAGYQAQSFVDGAIALTPIFVPATGVLTIMGVSVTAASPSGTLRMGLFDVQPGETDATLIADVGTVNTATTGLKDVGSISSPIGIAMYPGWYWVGIQIDGAVTLSGFNAAFALGMGNAASAAAQTYVMLYKSSSSGPFPNTITGLAEASGRVPSVALHIREPQP